MTDGNVLLNFVDNNGHPYFLDVRNLDLMINADWFQPFQNVQHSVRVIYLVIVNLPREVRFRQQNVIVLGVIPGSSEPNLSINTFLATLVDDLLAFFDVMWIKENSYLSFYKMTLIFASFDLPATRKFGGFRITYVYTCYV